MAAIQDAGFEILELPPYSPDLVPNRFYLFQWLNEYLRDIFKDVKEVMAGVNVFLSTQEDFLKREFWIQKNLSYRCNT